MHILIPALHRPSKPTGVCRHAANLARCLAETDPASRVTLLIGSWQLSYFKQWFDSSLPKVHLVTVDIKNTSISRNRWFMFGLPKLAERLEPNIIHMSFPFPFVRAWFKVPVVATIHDLYPYECPENFGYPQVLFNQLFLQQCIKNSDGFTCVSGCTLKALQTYFPNIKEHKHTAVIYNIVDFAGVSPSIPRSLGQFSAPFLMSVAQHRKNKNLDMLIQAYATLLKENRIDSYTRLILVGSAGPETDLLNQLVQTLDLENRVIFLSGLEDGELRWLYEQADLFVIPSSTEGFCLPLVESLTLNCPAVCSDIPIFREVGTSECYFFEFGVQAQHRLVEAISLALAHGLKQKDVVEVRFSPQVVSQQLLSFYESVYS